MPSTNAYDFLRQSIAGGMTGIDYTAIQPEELVYRDPREPVPAATDDTPPAPIPPILTLPPGMDMLDFVGRVERAHGLSYTDDKYLSRVARSDPGSDREHALELLDEGVVRMVYSDYPEASDLFSLCVILDPNYFYHFCLASARYHMGDFAGCLAQSRLALDEIRAGQELPPGAMFYYEQMDFVDGFYYQFIDSLLYTGQMDEAKRIADFAVDSNVFQIAQSYLDLAAEFSLFGEREYAAKLIDRMMPYMDELEGEARQLVLDWIPNILKGEPWRVGEEKLDK